MGEFGDKNWEFEVKIQEKMWILEEFGAKFRKMGEFWKLLENFGAKNQEFGSKIQEKLGILEEFWKI